MAKTRFWNNKYIVPIALMVLTTVIIFLTVRNDCLFNEMKDSENCEIARKDSIERNQIDNISSILKEAVFQLDSINRIQKENNEIEAKNSKSIQETLKQIEKNEIKILNSKK